VTSPTGHAPPRVGEIAPDFSLNSTAGQPVRLSSFRGVRPVLLAFFPLAFSSVCTVEMCEMGSGFEHLAGLNVELLPVRVDSVYTLREFKAKHQLPFDLLSDFKREVSRAYGVLLLDRFYSNRAYFLIDTEGVIRWAHVEEHPGLKRDTRELLEQIAALA
jgi:peroxiredoxin